MIEISRPEGGGDIADLGLTLAEGKWLLAHADEVLGSSTTPNDTVPPCVWELRSPKVRRTS